LVPEIPDIPLGAAPVEFLLELVAVPGSNGDYCLLLPVLVTGNPTGGDDSLALPHPQTKLIEGHLRESLDFLSPPFLRSGWTLSKPPIHHWRLVVAPPLVAFGKEKAIIKKLSSSGLTRGSISYYMSSLKVCFRRPQCE